MADELEAYFQAVEAELNNILSALDEPVNSVTGSVYSKFRGLHRLFDQMVKGIVNHKELAAKCRDTVYSSLFSDFWDVQKNTSVECKQELIASAKEAATNSEQYKFPEYLEQLEIALSVDGIIESGIIWGGYGNYTIEVELRSGMELLAGNIDDLENSIRAGRQLIANTQTGRPATATWMHKLFKPAIRGESISNLAWVATSGRYFETKEETHAAYTQRMIGLYHDIMRARLDGMGKKAPFWILLEDGNLSLTLKTDKGGTARPRMSPQRFLARAERRIQAILENGMKSVDNNLNSMADVIRYHERAITYYEDALKYIQELMASLPSEPDYDGGFFETEEMYIENQIGVVKAKVSQVIHRDEMSAKVTARANLRLAILANRLAAGEVSETERVYLGYRPGKSDLKLRMKRIVQQQKQNLQKTQIDIERLTRLAETNLKELEKELSKL